MSTTQAPYADSDQGILSFNSIDEVFTAPNSVTVTANPSVLIKEST